MVQAGSAPIKLKVGRTEIELMRCGSGRPLLFLHPEIGLQGSNQFVESLSEIGEVFAPVHPGYGEQSRPSWVKTIDDISYLYLGLLEDLGLHEVTIVGASLGGWIASAMASKRSSRIKALATIAPVGINPDPRVEVADMFAMYWDDLLSMQFHDKGKIPPCVGEEEIRSSALAREATALYAWSPYMHDPKLVHHLEMVALPSICIWGDKDVFTPQEYASAYARMLKIDKVTVIRDAGHYPHIEKPLEAASAVASLIQ